MEDETLSFDLFTASRSSQSRVKSHFELFIDFEEFNGDDELKTAYPCPYCAEDLDLLELCYHIDMDHPMEAKSGICPVCAIWVGMDMVKHITAQHGNIFKNQLKSRLHKLESYPTLYHLLKYLQDEHWQPFSAGSMSTSKTANDPLLSFLYSAGASEEHKNIQPNSPSELSIEEMHSDDTVLERDLQPSLSDKDQIENSRRSEFVQGLLVSTILDPDF